jgi:hypothetical protein
MSHNQVAYAARMRYIALRAVMLYKKPMRLELLPF